jgi:hypothetical protein
MTTIQNRLRDYADGSNPDKDSDLVKEAVGRIDLDATHIALLEIALKAAQAERDEYRKQCERAATTTNVYTDNKLTLWHAHRRITELEVERDALLVDAGRYRWLTMTSDTNPLMLYSPRTGQLFFGRAADEAIDAAMEQGGEK